MFQMFRKFDPHQKDPYLRAGIVFMGLIALLVLGRVYILLESGAGEGIATTAVISLMGLAFIIFGMGVAAGGAIEWMTHTHRFIFRKPVEPGSFMEKFLMYWGKGESWSISPVKQVSLDLSSKTVPGDFPSGTTMQDTEDWLSHINGRPSRGKKSAYSDDVRFRAVRDWRILQANGTSLTVNEFLAERFGTVQTKNKSMQRVPSSTFYGWWPAFDEDLAQFMEERQRKR